MAPAVEVEVEIAASCLLALKLKDAELDLALVREGLEPRQWPAVEIWRSPMRWITSDTHRQHLRDPLPLSVSPAHCPWRPEFGECQWHSWVIRALEQGGRSYRVVSTSATTQGMMAAAQAGLAVTNTLADDALPEGLRHVRADEGLPELPECRYLMLTSARAASARHRHAGGAGSRGLWGHCEACSRMNKAERTPYGRYWAAHC